MSMLRSGVLWFAVMSPQPLLAQPGETLAAYAAKTSVEPRCRAAAPGEITVCARRDADRYRLPFVEHQPGDPDHAGVPAERARMIATADACQEKRAILVGCGMAGVSVGTSFGVSGGQPRLRPLAP